LIHIEVQSQQETNFAERMFVYNYRIYDRYRRSVASLAVLGDENHKWRPNQFDYELFGCDMRFRFPVVKLLDYQQEWSALEASRNPFTTVVMAHLKALETRQNRNQRLQWKLALTRRLYEQGYERQDVINLFQFIDWMMTLPKELEQEFKQQISRYEEELRMPYITSIERMGIERGMQQGIEQGMQQGIERGTKRGLLKGIELGLKLKFGTEGLDLLSEISDIQDLNLLETILNQIKTANTLDQLRTVYQSPSQQEEN
jgi:flagellar biosynthesis/type III secretory pathway protein FliH